MTIADKFNKAKWGDKPLSAVRCPVCGGRMHEADGGVYYCTSDRLRFTMDSSGNLVREKDARLKAGGKRSIATRMVRMAEKKRSQQGA